MDKKVCYIHDNKLIAECNRLPTMLNRASIVDDLIRSYNILNDPKILLVQNTEATEDELKLFHSSLYINFLQKMNTCEDAELYEEEQAEFGLGYDCPLLENNYDFISSIAGGSLTAAKVLNSRKCDIAINWCGGWHHAQRDSAEGFCYVNDCVIAIQKLSEKFQKILYIDLDIHHGNGVENAFEFSKNILTLSFHKVMPGFYPGTGQLEDIGSGNGKYHSINVPFKEGISDLTYIKVFDCVFNLVYEAFRPDVLVVQCGADGLNGDPIGESNLTLEAYKFCVKTILNTSVPMLFLGGGGYNFANTARLWTYLTAIIIDKSLDNDIPDTAEYFTLYSPTYELHINPGLQKDNNNEEYIKKICDTIQKYIEKTK